MIYWTTVKPIQVIIISSITYSSSIIFWSFSYHICVIDCWHLCFHWSDQHLLILRLVLGCDCNFSVRRIQTGHTDLIPLQVCGRSWQECRLGVYTCLLQFISLLDIKSPSRYFSRLLLFIVDLCVSCLLDQRSLILKIVLECDLKLSVGNIQTEHTVFLPHEVCVRLLRGCRFFFMLSQSIHWLASSQFLKLFNFECV